MKETLNEEAQADLMSILELVDRELGDPSLPRPEGFGITVKEYAKSKGCSENIARQKLNEMVDRGLFKKRMMIEGKGNSPMVYFPKGALSPASNRG